MTATDRRNLTIVGAVALIVRLFFFFAYAPLLATDSHSYLALAHRLGALHLKGNPGARTPGYPALLMALGYSPRATWAVQALVGVATTLLLYRLIRRLGGSERWALAAGLLYALDLEFVALEHMVMTEAVTVFFLLLAGTLTVEIVLSPERQRRSAVALGLMLALACLVRPELSSVAIFIAVALFVATRRTAVLGLLLPVIVALGAWAAVNRATIGVTTVSTVIGHNIIDHVGRYVRAEPGRDHPIEVAYLAARKQRLQSTSDLANLSGDAEPAMENASHLDAPHLSGRLLTIGLKTIREHPVGYVASSVKQWPRFFMPPNYAYAFRGAAATPIRLAWKLERALRLLIAAAFLYLCLLAVIAKARRLDPGMSTATAVLSGIVAVGLLIAIFLAFGDTGRYGSVYYPLIMTVAFVAAEPRMRTIVARRRPLRA